MQKEVIEAVRVGGGDAGRVVGRSLKTLRQAAGFSQIEMARRLKVGQAAISKIEHRGDVQISSLRRYVEALGAKLRIDATFSADSNLAINIRGHLGNVDDGVQYVLPLFSEEFSPFRDIVLSVKPAYAEKILEGTKTVELRRRFTLSDVKGITTYIYSTSPVRAMVGTAQIKNVSRLSIRELWKHHRRSASIPKRDFDAYFEGLNEGYAVQISNARPFPRRIELAELKERFGFSAPQSYLYAKPNLLRALRNEHSNLSN
jgi:predicted transcriptional regulator/DNA-binding XRE family transcriptional regulator